MGWLVTGLWEDQPTEAATRKATFRGAVLAHAQGYPPEVTYSSRGSQLLVGLARGVQIDIFTATSFLTGGIFTLGRQGRGETMGQALWSALQLRENSYRGGLRGISVIPGKLPQC